VEIHEARGVANGDYFVDIKADDTLLASTSTKVKSQSPYWGEDFAFEYESTSFEI